MSPSRRIGALSGLAALVVAIHVGAAAPATAATAGSISGTWLASSYSARLLPMEGGAIPFTAAGQAAYKKNAAALAKGAAADTAHSMCVPPGVPRTLLAPYPFRVYQTPDQLVLIHEANRAYRIVAMTDKHADPDVWDPSYMGNGIARVDGDAVVIDTTNFNDKTWLDDSGLPHGDKLHVVERLRTIAGGQELEDLVTIEDPEYFTRPWTARLTFRLHPDLHIVTDWVCGEPHRSVTGVKGAKAYR